MQTLLAEGEIDAARNFLGTIHMELGIGTGRPLPVRELHRAAFPTRSTRPEMIDLPMIEDRSQSDQKSITTADDIEVALKVPESGNKSASVALTDAALIDLYKQVQQDLARRVPYAFKVDAVAALECEMYRSLDLDPLDRAGIEAMLDIIHCRAFEDPQTRPDRIILDLPGGSPLE